VVSAVVASPPSDGALDGTAADSSQEDLEGNSGGVGSVSPQAMVTGSDTETSGEVEGDRPDGGLEVERSPVGGDETAHGNADDENDIEPVHVLVPVLLCHGSLGDVRLLRVVLCVPDRLLRVRLGGGRGLAGEVGRVDGHHAGGGLVGRHVLLRVFGECQWWLLECWRCADKCLMLPGRFAAVGSRTKRESVGGRESRCSRSRRMSLALAVRDKR
jgi:hypothetical protein